jgi:3-oxoacyl-[acyl-carrier-protein] synthase-1
VEVVVTGLGIVASIGNNVNECLQSFELHQSGIQPLRNLNSKYAGIMPVGEVKLSNEKLQNLTGLTESYLSRSILLSYTAVIEAIKDINISSLGELNVGFISGTTVGGMDITENSLQEYFLNEEYGNIQQIRNHDCGKITDYVAQKLGIQGLVTTISTACSSSANAIMLGARMIKNHQLDIVIAGGVDALTRFTLNGFNALQILDNSQCRPLDESRAGLNIGEGAAYIVLMSDKIAKKLQQNILCKVSGYCNVNDSFHQTALSDEGVGPQNAMKGALKKAGLMPEEISYINLHGTGTRNNDSAECSAVMEVFGENYPKLSSTKSFTGHTLGASGAVEAVFSILSIKEQIVFPNYLFSTKMEGMDIIPVTQFEKNVPIQHVLSNSFGFGGNCTSLIFSRFS